MLVQIFYKDIGISETNENELKGQTINLPKTRIHSLKVCNKHLQTALKVKQMKIIKILSDPKNLEKKLTMKTFL